MDQVADLDKGVQDGSTELVLAQTATWLAVASAESQHKKRGHHDSVETLYPLSRM